MYYWRFMKGENTEFTLFRTLIKYDLPHPQWKLNYNELLLGKSLKFSGW